MFCCLLVICCLLVSTESISTPLPQQPSTTPLKQIRKWDFETNQGRDARFQNMYKVIGELEEVELDKRFATAVRLDPFISIQFLLSIYIFFNHIIESFLPQNYRLRIRIQNLVTEIGSHIVEIWQKIKIPEELSNDSGMFLDNNILMNARNDMMKIAKSREGQQIAYSLLCMLNGTPSYCVLPLIIRDLPLLLKSFGIIFIVCFPDFRIKYMMGDFYDNLYLKIDNDEDHIENENTKNNENSAESVDDEIKNSENTDGNSNDENSDDDEDGEEEISDTTTTTSFIENIKQFKSHINNINTNKSFSFVCEILSFLLEHCLLTSALFNFSNEKINLPTILKKIICAAFAFQYLWIVRGETYRSIFISLIKH